MDWLGLSRLPFLCRRNFHYEFRYVVLWNVLAALVEGRFGSIVVSTAFHAPPGLVAIAAATPVAAFIFSLYWGILCAHNAKVHLLTVFGVGTILCASAAALAPLSPGGAVWFIVQMALAQIFLAAVLTFRPALWEANYPTEIRGRIIARLQAARILIATIVSLAAATLCDLDPAAFRFLYPCCAALGAVSLLFLVKVRVRGERRRNENAPRPVLAGEPGAGARARALSPLRVTAQMIRVFREDRRFFGYCLAQFLLGVANLMSMAVLTVILTKELTAWNSRVFWISTVLLMVMPKLLQFGSLRAWGGLFDRVGVLRFRVINCVFWNTSILCGLAGSLCIFFADRLGVAFPPLMVTLFALQVLTYGLGMGGGTLAWNIGHLHFAAPENGDLYMGIHVTLTGVRGLFSAVVGIWIWTQLAWGVWLVILAVMLLSTVQFWRLARQEPARPGDQLEHGIGVPTPAPVTISSA